MNCQPSSVTCDQGNRQSGLVLLLAITLATAGCGSGTQGPPTFPVTGTVTYKGEKIGGALLLFHPVEKGKGVKTGSGETDETGSFAMQTQVKGGEYKDGLQPASYQVTIEKLDHSHRANNPHLPPKNVLPVKYGIPADSGLTADVTTDGENRFSFDLE